MSERKITLLKRKLRTLTVNSELIEVHKELAEHLYDAGRHQDALDHLKEGLTFCTRQLQTAKLQRLIGEIYIEIGKSELAEPYFRQYLKNANADKKELQKSQVTLGRYLYIRAVELKHLWAEGSRLMLSEAKSHMEDALIEVTSENKDLAMQCRIYLNLGLILEELQGAREAAMYLKKARTMADEANLREEEFRCLTVTASLFRRHGGAEMAMGLMQGAALKAARQAGTETQCQHTLDYSEHLIADNRLEDASKCLAAAIKLRSPPKTIKDLIQMKYKEVQRAIRLQRRICHGDNKFLSLIKLAKFYCSVDTCSQRAIDLLVDKVNDVSPDINAEHIAKLHKTLGLAYRLNGQFSDAANNYEKAAILRKRSSTLRELALCKLCSRKPFNEVMLILEEAGRIDIDMKGCKTSNTLDSMIYTKKSFGLPVDDLIEERSNLVNTEEESSDSDTSEEATEYCSPLSDEENDINEKVEVSRNMKGETPLHIASARGQLETVKQLLFKEKHAINVRDFNGWLPLHEAINFNRIEVVKLLLDNGAAINDRGADEGTTPLHDACQNGLLDCIETLLEYGANPCIKNNLGLTPLDVLYKVRQESTCSAAELIRCQQVENRMLEDIRKTLPDYEIIIPTKISPSKQSSPRKLKSVTISPSNITDACKSAIQVYCGENERGTEKSPKEKKSKSSRKRKSRAFLSEEEYDNVQFTVPDNFVEFDESNSSSNTSPEVKSNVQRNERSDVENNSNQRVRVIVHVDSSPQAKLLIPFDACATIQELKIEIENRIRRKLTHLKSWTKSDLYDMNDCMLDEVDNISDIISIEREKEWYVKVRLFN